MYTLDLQEAYLWDPPELESKLKFLDAQITEFSSEFEIQKEELDKLTSEDTLRIKTLEANRSEMVRIRRDEFV